MKTFKTTLTIAALGLVTLLTGCATHPDLKASFTRGDEILYGRASHIWQGKEMGVAHNILCGNKYSTVKKMSYTEEVDRWVAEHRFCEASNLDSIQQVRVTVGVIDANGGMFHVVVFPPKNLTVNEGDIVAFKVFPGSDGRGRRPEQFIKIAAKAKDATKENGCYWDAGTGVFSGFNRGGAVCEGWHWKNHPFSNPRLLKQ